VQSKMIVSVTRLLDSALGALQLPLGYPLVMPASLPVMRIRNGSAVHLDRNQIAEM